MKVKSAAEIKRMIGLLKLQRKGIPAYSGFGDNNHQRLDEAIKALESLPTSDKVLFGMKFDLSDREDHALDLDRRGEADAYAWVLHSIDDLVEENDHWVKKAREAK